MRRPSSEGDEVKFRFIHAKKAALSVAFICRQLDVSRSGYYAWAKSPESQRKKSDRELKVEVGAIFQESRGTYGSRHVHAEMRARGRRSSEKRVARHMRQEGLAARRRRPSYGPPTACTPIPSLPISWLVTSGLRGSTAPGRAISPTCGLLRAGSIWPWR
ncbi:HTH-like domain-containing protein [Myxococcus virescens]|uniref:HTH-like domain-containing protein n=1 Tax=Myxococcus virescens TaxID=83456 RepID=A0ABY0N7D0_9BACT|nr:HTH-like domain-containing protein [Myxococcus virescens]